MQQRAGLARALATNPRIMLMDEPLGALDAQTREVLQFELLNLFFVSPITTVVVTHSIEEAVLFGDRVAIIRGKPSEIVETVTVELPKPRGRSVISSPEFVSLREHVWSQVMASSSSPDS
jgi:NitT/TauT family transport system ATP-binding protein